MMQLATNPEKIYPQRDTSPAKPPNHNMNTKLKAISTQGSNFYPYPDVKPSELDGFHHAMTADLWYTENGDIVTKRELHQIHDYSFTEYPIYDDLKNPNMADIANTENGVYLLPLTSARFEPVESEKESPPKKGLFKNLKTALFAKKNAKRPKAKKQTLHLPVINMSPEFKQPGVNREFTINNLRSAYSMDCLNVIENTIVWRELSDTKDLVLKNKHVECITPNNQIRRNSGPDILADILKNNTINEGLTNESLMQRIQMQSEKAKTTKQNSVTIFAHTQKGVEMSESQSEIYFGEEEPESTQGDQEGLFRFPQRQDTKIIPRYYQQHLQHQPLRILSKHLGNKSPTTPLSKLKNSLTSSTSSSVSSASSTQFQDDSCYLSLSALSLNSARSQNLLDRHFHTLETNSPRRKYFQPQNGFTRGLSESGVSVESSDSGFGSGSYVSKVKRTVHFNGSDEVFEYVPVNSGNCRPHRLRQGTMAVRNRGRKTKIATYL